MSHCATCNCADDAIPPRPATSSEWARRQALEAAAEAVRKAKGKPATTTAYSHDCEHDSLQHGADGCNVPGCLCAFQSWDASDYDEVTP